MRLKIFQTQRRKGAKARRFLLNYAFASLRLCVFAFIIFAGFVFAQETPPAPSAPRSISLPKTVEKTLPNGLRVIVIERKNVPLVTAQLFIKSGGETDRKNLSGLADFTASLLTKGTKTRSATQIAEQIEFLGGSINTGANWDFSSTTVNVMSDKLDKALGIMSDVARNPAFKQEEIDTYRAQLLDELSVRMKQPGTIASYTASAVVFNGENYGHPLSGTPESVKRIQREDIKSFHFLNYSPKNSVLVFTGDISSQKGFLLAEKWFRTWTNPKIQKEIFYGDPAVKTEMRNTNSKVAKIVVVDLPNAGQAAVQYVERSLNRTSKDYFRANVLNSVLGGGYSARLNQEIRIKRGLSYGANSSFSMRENGGIFSMRTQTKNESAAEVAELYVEELERLAKGDLPDIELVPRKSVLTGTFGRNLETTQGIANVVGELAVYDLPLSEINSYIQNINTVSSSDVKSFAGSHLSPKKGTIVIVGDAGKFMDDLKKRFPNTTIRVIPSDKLDLESENLEKK